MNATVSPAASAERSPYFDSIPRQVSANLYRLTSGQVESGTLYYISTVLANNRRRRGEFPLWTRGITSAEIAKYAWCSVRCVDMALKDLLDRQLLKREKREGEKGYCYYVPYETYDTFPNRPGPVLVKKPASQTQMQDTETSVTYETDTGAAVPVFNGERQQCRPGMRTKARPLPKTTSAIRVNADCQIEYSAQIRGDVLDISIFHSSQVKAPGDPGPAAGTTAVMVREHSSFAFYLEAAGACQLSGSKIDIEHAEKLYGQLSESDRRDAVRGLWKRLAAREYPGRVKFRPYIHNYLERRIWERAVKAEEPDDAPKMSAKEVERQAHYQRMMDIARAMDEADQKKGE